MIGFSSEERLAIFLTLLGDQAVSLPATQLQGDRPQKVKQYLDEFKQEPPNDEDLRGTRRL
jgi:hypothetical protein